MGNGRCGFTINIRALGKIEDFSVGEIRQIWDRNALENRYAGDGVRFNDLEVWQKIFQSAFAGFDGNDAYKMVRMRVTSSLETGPVSGVRPLSLRSPSVNS